jgi:quinol monooxygenase YgiN
VSDPALILLADVHGLTGLGGELSTLLEELAEASRREPDCVEFRVLAAEQPGDFLMLASWSSEPGLREHYGTAHYRRYREQVGPMLARPSNVVVHHLSASVHALDPNPPDPGKLG